MGDKEGKGKPAGTHPLSAWISSTLQQKMTNDVGSADIKLKPYRERIFASLYFAGNGHFNISMRFWAARKFNFTLNDHGLVERGIHDRMRRKASIGLDSSIWNHKNGIVSTLSS
jgi:hypothetical protein